MLLAKNDVLRRIYTKQHDRLQTIMGTVLDQNKGIQYEAFLLLSLFILMPMDDNLTVKNILIRNQANLNDFIRGF